MTIRKSEKLPVINRIAGISIFLYYIAIFMTYVTDISIRQDIYYVASLFCVVVFLFWKFYDKKLIIHNSIAFFAVACAITGILNLGFVGNTSLIKILECAFINIVIACMFIEMKLNKNVLLIVLYVYCAYFAYLFLSLGIGASTLLRYSNNFVSVILLFPLVMYYSVSVQNGEKITFVPAFIAWVLSLLASGRSGIGAFSVIFLGVFLFCAFSQKHDGEKSIYSFLFHTIRRFFLLIFVGVFIYYIFEAYSGEILRKFLLRGMDNQSRLLLWNDYIEHASRSIEGILLGYPKSNLIMGMDFAGNAHNSFVNIHADNGILIIVVLFLLLKSIIYAIKNRMWIFLTCLISFCFRGAFDNVFWGTKGTVMLMYFMFFPLLYSLDGRNEEDILK